MTAEVAEEVPASYASTLQHIELLHGKQCKLRDAQVEAEEQVLHRLAADYKAGVLEMEDLYRFYLRFRLVAVEGWTHRWDWVMPITASKVRGEAERYLRDLPSPDGTWSGTYPLGGQGAPPDYTSVIYVLFDPKNVPCYVGSTYRFRTRLKWHRKKGKDFDRWLAYRCDDREAAYQLEERLLREHLPYLNKKAFR